MRLAQLITIGISVAFVGLLWWKGNTIPPKQSVKSQVSGGHMDEAEHAMSVSPASFDSILIAARKSLPAHAASELDAIYKKIESSKDSSHNGVYYTQLAKLWQQHKHLPVAAFYYAQAAKLDNSEKNLNFAGQFFLDLMHEAGNASVQQWEADQAVQCLNRALEINSKNDTTKLALAAAYIEGTGQTMDGVKLLKEITTENPQNVPANLMLGRLSIQSGQFDKAVNRFETILKVEPRNQEALYFLAEAYKGKGDKQKAIELFELCKKIVNKPEFSKDIDQYINSFK